jgi:hypothetical protein
VSIVKHHTLSEEELIEGVYKELTEWYGGQVKQWKHLRTYHIPQALPAFTAVEPSNKDLQLSDHLFRCGDYTAYPSLNAAMQTGREVASLVAEKIEGLVAGK